MTYEEVYKQQKDSAKTTYEQQVNQANQAANSQKQEAYINQQKALNFLNTLRSYNGQQGISTSQAIGVQNDYQNNLNEINQNKQNNMDSYLAQYQSILSDTNQNQATQQLSEQDALSTNLQGLATYGLESRLNNLLSEYSSEQDVDTEAIRSDLTKWLTDQYGNDLTESDTKYLNAYIDTLLQNVQGTKTSETVDDQGYSTNYDERSKKYAFDYNGKTLYLDFSGAGEGYKADNLFRTSKKEDVATAVDYMLKSGEMPTIAEIKNITDITSTKKANTILDDLEEFLKQNNVTLS